MTSQFYIETETSVGGQDALTEVGRKEINEEKYDLKMIWIKKWTRICLLP